MPDLTDTLKSKMIKKEESSGVAKGVAAKKGRAVPLLGVKQLFRQMLLSPQEKSLH